MTVRTAPPASRLRRWVVAGVAVALVVTAYLALPLLARFEHGVVPEFSAGTAVTVPEFEGTGANILDYRHGARITVTVPVTNRGPLPVTVSGVVLTEEPRPLLAAAAVRPFDLAPGETARVAVTAAFGNCRYYNERQIQTMPSAIVTGEVLGRSFRGEVAFDRPLVVASPMIVDCPDRTLSREDDGRR